MRKYYNQKHIDKRRFNVFFFVSCDSAFVFLFISKQVKPYTSIWWPQPAQMGNQICWPPQVIIGHRVAKISKSTNPCNINRARANAKYVLDIHETSTKKREYSSSETNIINNYKS